MPLRPSDVRRRFDLAAENFDDFDFVHTVTREGLFARLEPMTVAAKVVVDLGCATGGASKMLAKRFRRSHIISVDHSSAMLRSAAGKKPWFTKGSFVEADAAALPLDDQSVDVVFCNQLLPWIDDVPAVFAEVNRILRKNGLFLFASLGPDSFAELRSAWQAADDESHVHHFADMHNIGDAAVRAGLGDPVLDVDRLKVSYSDSASLFRDLTGSAARNCLDDRRRSLTGKARFNVLRQALQPAGSADGIELDLELVYGHCWGSGKHHGTDEFRISLSEIAHRK
ncbi:MAG: methyltransferase domain-containing protein [Woeseiaceae bacterium]